MNRIILADNQAIFRAGAARVLVLEEDMRIVAQCDDLARIMGALEAHRGAILLLAASLQLDGAAVVARAHAVGNRTILIAENGTEVADGLTRSLDGMIFRNVPGADLIDCIRRLRG